MRLEAVDTPALLIELDAFERNLRHMAACLAGGPVKLRAHAKTHKCPAVAHRQMALGAVGVCCQKVGEAEAMVLGGVPDVYISNEVVGPPKIARLAALARQARVSACVDDADNARQLAEAARAYGVVLPVLVEINVGADRCGVEPGEPAVALARHVAAQSGLHLAGLQAYHGRAQHIRDFDKRREAIAGAVEQVRRTLEGLRAAGLPCETVSGAGTGTFHLEADSGVYTELQAGSYPFMDVDYAQNRDERGLPFTEFVHALFVYATVMSRPTRERAVVDAGLKALGVDAGLPAVHGLPDVEYVRPSDEHGKLLLHDPERALRVGDKLLLVPGHCDPTINLYDWYVGVRNGRVECLWPITARGAVR
jgi:D-serine deaminase-like pyridoxal phosphate-dependent protein